MGEPIIIWPPGCGNYTGADCSDLLGPNYYDCTDDGSGDVVCCLTGE